MDTVCIAVVDSARTGHVLDAGSDVILHNSHLMHTLTQAVFTQSVCLKKAYHST